MDRLNKIESHVIMANEVIVKLRQRYNGLHPVLFIYSLEKATSLTHLFDTLDSFTGDYPVSWDDKNGQWLRVQNLF